LQSASKPAIYAPLKRGQQMFRLIAAICILFFPCLAKADMMGSHLKEICQSYPANSESTSLCRGYIWGALDTARGVVKLQAACEPVGVNGEQLVALTIKYMDDHPEELKNSAASLIWKMYAKAFPCQKNSR
jgi:hypothetical protein